MTADYENSRSKESFDIIVTVSYNVINVLFCKNKDISSEIIIDTLRGENIWIKSDLHCLLLCLK